MRKSLVTRYEHLLPSGFSFTTTITLAAACNGHNVEYLPIDYHARLGESKIRARHAYDFAILTLRTIVFFNPLKKDNLSESAVLGSLGALIVWAVGLLADQNARTSMRS
jgi:hypothetical protein